MLVCMLSCLVHSTLHVPCPLAMVCLCVCVFVCVCVCVNVGTQTTMAANNYIAGNK